MSKRTKKHTCLTGYMSEEGDLALITAGQVRGFTVAMAPIGTPALDQPCVVMQQDSYYPDGPVVVVDRWFRPITDDNINEMAAKARKLGLVVSRVLYLPPDADEARLQAMGL